MLLEKPSMARARAWTAVAIAGLASSACKSGSSAPRTRQWTRCICTYISDFDDQGRAPIDVCTEGRGTEEIAETCVRNDGVGIPTSCTCDAAPKGPCEKSDRCRPVSTDR